MYEHNRSKCYSQLRNLIQKDDIIKYIHLMNKIKEHRHNKKKGKQIDKFKCLLRKSNGYLHNVGTFITFGGHILLGWHPQSNANTQNTRNSISANNTTTTTTSSTKPTTPATITITTTVPAITADTKHKCVINLPNTPSPKHRNSF